VLEDVKHAIEEYKEKYRRPGLPDLEFSGLYALFPDEATTPDVSSRWNETWSLCERCGVYFIFGRSETLLYIGKASMNNSIGSRLSTYFQCDDSTGGCRLRYSVVNEKPMYVAALAVPENMPFEAAGLEEFLIRRLRPCDNVRGSHLAT
jgi:hypothetical protein